MRALAALAVVVAAVLVVVVATSGSSTSSKPAKQARQHAAPTTRATHPAKPPPPKIVHGPHDQPVPILMYHVVSQPQPGAPYPELYTPKGVFAAQMRALHDHGYHGVTLRQVDDYWHKGYALPARPVVISFDDGYLSQYTHAGPVLKALGWPGVLNLEVHNAQTPGDISVREVKSLIRDGWEVDSHTVNHPDLTTLPADRLRYELVQSRSWLRSTFGVPVDYFCYPSGRFNSTVEAAVRAAGYRLATTTQPGLASPARPYELDRIRIDGADSGAGVLQKIANPGSLQAGSVG